MKGSYRRFRRGINVMDWFNPLSQMGKRKDKLKWIYRPNSYIARTMLKSFINLIEPYVTFRDDIEKYYIDQYYSKEEAQQAATESKVLMWMKRSLKFQKSKAKLGCTFDWLDISQAIKTRTNLIAIEPAGASCSFGVDGHAVETCRTANAHSAIATRIKIMSGLDIASSGVPPGWTVRVISTARSRYTGFSLAYVFGEKNRYSDFERNALIVKRSWDSPTNQKLFLIYLTKKSIILLTGPTGSGKTTTLYSAPWAQWCLRKKHIMLLKINWYRWKGVSSGK